MVELLLEVQSEPVIELLSLSLESEDKLLNGLQPLLPNQESYKLKLCLGTLCKDLVCVALT